MQSDIGVCL